MPTRNDDLLALPIEGWTVRPIGAVGHVPLGLRGRVWELGAGGYVHQALIAAGEIPPLDAPGGEPAQEWVGRTDWACAAWIRVAEEHLRRSHVHLVFDWIDTLGDVRINGVRVAAVASEFTPFRRSIKSLLRVGVNEVEVRLRGPVAAVEALARRLGARPVNGDWTPYPFLRKCASNFGWDWGPRMASVGLGGARIEIRDHPWIESCRPLVVSCSETRAIVDVHVACAAAGAGVPVAATLTSPDGFARSVEGVTDEHGRSVLQFIVDAPKRWWPRGCGEQHRYALVVACAEGADRRLCRIGLRSVELDTSVDGAGSAFVIRVNDTPIWCRGANWVPRSPLPRERPAQLDDLESLAAEANLNLLRVWGGGIYECEEFYDRCDELGIMVWQDFMFACATYPEEPPYAQLVEEEARHQIARLSPHPSVVLWCGGNENILAWWSWGFKEKLAPGQTWGRHFWLELLPRLVHELDPTRPYWPDSPWSGSIDVHPNDPDRGDRHSWDVRFEAYRTVVPRFCSEFGHQSPPTRPALDTILSADQRVIGNVEMAHRQRAWGGDAFQYAPHLRERFRDPLTLDQWVLAAQLLQARAYELAILWLRANAPRCMGAVFWQWNDVWTGHSWSVVDALGFRKPAYFSVQRAAAPLALAVLPDPLRVVVCRDRGVGQARSDEPVAVRARLVDASGETRRDVRLSARWASDWHASVDVPPTCIEGCDPTSSLLVIDAGDMRAAHAFVHDRDFRWVRAEARVGRDGDAIVIEAATLMRDVVIDELLKPATSCFTLLPGESRRVRLAQPHRLGEPNRDIFVSAEDIGRADRA